MSAAPVAVLAVMDADIALRRSIYDEGRGTKPIARTEQNAHNLVRAIEARAAIGELIEACKERDAALAAYEGIPDGAATTSVAERWNRLNAARLRYAAALARTGGGT